MARVTDLSYLIGNYKPDIMYLCETWLRDGDHLSFPNYNVVVCNRSGHGGGVAILVQKQISFSQYKPQDLLQLCYNAEMDVCFIQTSGNNLYPFYIYCIYNLPNVSSFRPEGNSWPGIVEVLNDLGHVFICGDLNAGHNSWFNNSPTPNKAGRQIHNAILDSDFVKLNDRSPTWRSKDLSHSNAIDLVLTTPRVSDLCTRRMLDYGYGSDHFPVVLDMGCSKLKKSPCRSLYSTKKINWGKFTERIEFLYCEDTEIPVTESNCVKLYSDVVDNIHSALNVSGAMVCSSRISFRSPPTY